MLDTPLIVVNFKTYSRSIGKKGLKLSRLIERESEKNWAVCPQPMDIRMTEKQTNLPIFAQHVDDIEPGSNTGHLLLEAVKDAGAKGTIINHSENRVELSKIEKIVKMCKKENMVNIVCANNPDVAASAAALSPDFVAYEPPELIGGDVSVSSAKPEVIEEAVRKVKDINPEVKVLCGAGVKDGDDVKKALDLGTEGVLLASGLVKAKNRKDVIHDLESEI